MRQYGAISALDLLRRALDASARLSGPRSQEAHSRVTLDGKPRRDPVRQGGMAK